jgi:hypothetical protein
VVATLSLEEFEAADKTVKGGKGGVSGVAQSETSAASRPSTLFGRNGRKGIYRITSRKLQLYLLSDWILFSSQSYHFM